MWPRATTGSGMGSTGSPTSHDPSRSTGDPGAVGGFADTPRGGFGGAARARGRRVETRRDGRRRRGAVARDGDGDGVGRRTPDAGDAPVR